MTYDSGGKAVMGCLGVLTVGLLLVTYLSTSSLNPVGVFSSRSLTAKIVVALLGLLIASALLRWVSLHLFRQTLRVMTGKPAGDVLCHACGLPLMQYAGSHGFPMPCPRCRQWYHMGPACYAKGLGQRSPPLGLPCPRCRTVVASDRELFADSWE
jgi:hypothetical protein